LLRSGNILLGLSSAIGAALTEQPSS